MTSTVSLTDDPAKTGNPLTTLYAGTAVTYLSTMFNDTGWDYVETTINGQTARGFIPCGYLELEGDDGSIKDGFAEDISGQG